MSLEAYPLVSINCIQGGGENEATPENNSVDNKEVDDSQGDEVDEANDNFELQVSQGSKGIRQLMIRFIKSQWTKTMFKILKLTKI